MRLWQWKHVIPTSCQESTHFGKNCQYLTLFLTFRTQSSIDHASRFWPSHGCACLADPPFCALHRVVPIVPCLEATCLDLPHATSLRTLTEPHCIVGQTSFTRHSSFLHTGTSNLTILHAEPPDLVFPPLSRAVRV